MPERAKTSLPDNTTESRTSERKEIRLKVTSASSQGKSFLATVLNLSSTGLLLEADAELTTGEKVLVELPQTGLTAAVVAWAGDRVFGCQFLDPLSRAAVGAALLQSPPVQERSTRPAPNWKPAEPFHARLQRLREEKGLSIAELADLTQVSKPSVWNWENDKARPKASNLESLAQGLGTTVPDLLFGGKPLDEGTSPEDVSEDTRTSRVHDEVENSDHPSVNSHPWVNTDSRLAQLIAASKEQIAALAGTHATKIRILVEF